jgi:uncharacterized membrane protein HdeD (DUF308 family)
MSRKIVKIINRYFLRNRLLSLASRILLIIAGIVIAVTPLESYLAMTVIFGIFLLIAGIAETGFNTVETILSVTEKDSENRNRL